MIFRKRVEAEERQTREGTSEERHAGVGAKVKTSVLSSSGEGERKA